MQPTWAQIAAAFQSTVQNASGLATIWGYQSADQPPLDYIRLSLGAAATAGVDWVDERYDGAQSPHQQIVLTTGGVREVALQLEAWSSGLVEQDAQASALSILDGVVTRLRLPAARNALAAVGVVPFDPGPTNWLPSIVAVGFRGRATCDVRCRMPARALVEYADWIASIETMATASGAPGGDLGLDIYAVP